MCVDVRYMLFVVCRVVRFVRRIACCLSLVVCCVLFAVWSCLQCAVCRVLFVVGCSLFITS